MNNLVQMKEHVAVVAGAGSGIGAASAVALAARGVNIAVLDINLGNAENVATLIRNNGGAANAYKVDLTDGSAVAAVVKNVYTSTGRIDICVNAVGVTGPTGVPTHLVPMSDFKSTFEVNFFSAISLQSAVTPYMLEAKYGRIVHIASISGKEGNPNMAPYSSSKAAIIGLVKSSAKELAKDGVTVNAVAPAVVRTPINDNTAPEVLEYMLSKIPMGRMGEPREVGEMVAFIASPDCAFTTGFVFDLSGGRATY